MQATVEWTEDRIREKLATNAVMVERSLLYLFSLQEPDEREGHVTVAQNGVGFNRVDAAFLTSVAKYVRRSTRAEGERMTPKQLFHARKSLRKYARQLARHAVAASGRH